jgi:hypothetical protein
MEIISLRIKLSERETDKSLPSNAEDEFLDLHLHSTMYIHGVMVNEADGVWEQRVEEDNFV